MPWTNQDAIITEFIHSSVDEMSEKKFQINIIKMICEAKNNIREEIKATMDHTKKEIREEIQVVKLISRDRDPKFFFEMKETINQI